MRGLRSTIALLVVLGVLCGYIYFVLSKKPEGGSEEKKEHVFVSLDADKIDDVTVKSEMGDTTSMKKADGAWRLTSPVMTKADESQTTSLTLNLSTLEVSRVVDENPTDLKEYGLDPPRVEIEFKASGDKAAHRLLIGAKSPTGGGMFVKRDADKRVLLAPAYTDASFNRGTFDLRDKALIAFDRTKVDRISISTAGGAPSIEMAKEGGDWKLVKPLAAAADATSVDSLLGRLQSLAMKSIVTEQATPEDLKKYGFEKPQGQVTVTAGGAASTLIIGGAAGQDSYMRGNLSPLIATADPTPFKKLQMPVDDFRQQQLFALRSYLTDRVEFTRDGQTIVFEKVKAAGQTPEKWRRVSPNAGDPAAVPMDDLLSKLESLRVESFTERPKTALDKPTLTVYAKFSENKEERVPFAKSGADIFASPAGQPAPVKVATADFEALMKALDVVSK